MITIDTAGSPGSGSPGSGSPGSGSPGSGLIVCLRIDSSDLTLVLFRHQHRSEANHSWTNGKANRRKGISALYRAD